ncbi:MAG TPA: magnesium transporter CorA family protein [Acetobacteraceae bacterium]|jgi:magnesium transporter|nr:magnesium transporter CorA family protein [Acetobacteraceae bacterium]
MLTTFTCDGTVLQRSSEPSDAALREAVWIELLNASEDEIRRVDAMTGDHVPTEADLREIESSSRLSVANGVLTLSLPLVTRLDGDPQPVPGGFVLSQQRLITIRFAASTVFDGFAEREMQAGTPDRTGAHLFVGLLEAIVDRHADALELIRDDLDAISHRIFRDAVSIGGSRREDRMLRETLAAIGRKGDVISFIRDSQVGAARIVPYVLSTAADWLPQDLKPRLDTLRQDIASLNDFDTHLNDKLQFLLDATLGFINIAQNNVMKVLTVASVVGIPPVLIAGIYGMNFKSIPEYDWAWGYAYGLALIVVSGIVPLAIFRWRNWI